MTIDEHGPLCRCGNRGCLEAIAGGPAIIDGLRETNGPQKLTDVVVHAIAGDHICIRAIADAGRQVGIAAANVCNLLAPERIVVGGELARAGELFLGPLRHSLERSVVMSTDKVADVVQGQLGDARGTHGGGALRHRSHHHRPGRDRSVVRSRQPALLTISERYSCLGFKT